MDTLQQIFLTLSIDRVDIYFFLLLITLVSIALILHKRYASMLFFITSIAITSLAVHILKITFMVERPANALVHLNSFAFPSGHAASSSAIVVCLYLLYAKKKKSPFFQIGISLAVILALLVGQSRISLHVHTLWQVIAGYGVGIIMPLVVQQFFKKATLSQ